MQRARALVLWHRGDLRLHDNALYAALEGVELLVPVFVFDVLDRKLSHAGNWSVMRQGPFKLEFVRQALEALRSDLRDRQSTPGHC